MSDNPNLPDATGAAQDNQTPVTSQTTPESGQSGQVNQQDQAHSQDNYQEIPEKYKGKSAQDIIKMHMEAEKKIGEHSKTVGQYNELQKQNQILNEVFTKNPEVFKQVQEAFIKMYDTGNGGQDDKSQQAPQKENSDVRSFTQNQIIKTFQEKYHITGMDPEKKSELMQKVSNKIADILDPSGKKTMQTILSEVDINKLPSYLEDAYWLTQRDFLAEKGSLPQDLSSIGSLISGGKSGSGSGLSEQERKVAANMGISEEEYLANKK